MIKNIISVLFTFARFLIIKLFYGNRFKYGRLQRFSPDTSIEIGKKGLLILGKKVRAHTGTKIRVRNNATIKIGNNVAFSYNCILTARKLISIGEGCEIAPGVMIYDHDHEYRSCSIHADQYRCADVIIGKNVWIGANVIILRGVTVGDGCVVAAGTVVRKGEYPSNSLICGPKETQVIPIDKER